MTRTTLPKVSVVVPMHNAAEWIQECIFSVLAQTWENVEVIAIDDHSTDDSCARLRQLQHEEIRLLRSPGRGAACARNAGLAVATGELVQFLDADDVIAPDKLAVQVERYLKYGDAHVFACGWGRFTGTFEASNVRSCVEPVWATMNSEDWLACSWNGGGMMPVHAWLIPMQLIRSAGNWNSALTLNDDGEYMVRVLKRSVGVVFSERIMAYYRSGSPGSVSRRRSPTAFQSAYKSLVLSQECVFPDWDSVEMRRGLAARFIDLSQSSFAVAPEIGGQAFARAEELVEDPRALTPNKRLRILSRLIGWPSACRVHALAATVRDRIANLVEG